MRCKKHLQDLTSTVGVCASCLRHRLHPLLHAQQARVLPRSSAVVVSAASSDYLKNPDQDDSIGLNFPRSVSPYVSRRKTHRDRRLDLSFYSTPHAGPTFDGACDGGKTTSSKKRLGKFWIISNLFQSRSNKPEISSLESCDPSSSAETAAAASPSWFSTILPDRRQNRRRDCEQSDHGISTEDNFIGADQSPSVNGYFTEESPQRLNQTAVVVAKRSRFGSAGKTLSGMVICLSPLVRASPNRHWSQKGMVAQDSGGSHNHISYCANRSRKLADFGRLTHN